MQPVLTPPSVSYHHSGTPRGWQAADALEAELQAAGAAAEHNHNSVHRYAGVGHDFLSDSPSAIARKQKLGQGRHDQASRSRGWRRHRNASRGDWSRLQRPAQRSDGLQAQLVAVSALLSHSMRYLRSAAVPLRHRRPLT